MAVDVFAVPVFLIVFRETLETTIIVSVLLAFLKQTLDGPDGDIKAYRRLRRQVWLGTGIGFLICMIIGGACIGSFYRFGSLAWELNENAYEGAFALVAAIIISIMGAALLRVGKIQSKWKAKLAKALDKPLNEGGGGKRGWLKRFSERYAMFLVPFITVLREGVEAVVFVAGVSFSFPAKSIPLPTVVGLGVGCLVGYILYKGGSSTKLQMFLVLSTCLLYLVAAGLFSRSVWHFEMQVWTKYIGGEASEFGAGPGSYDIDQSVWHVNCCAPNTSSDGGGGWGIFNAIFGWTNSATYGSVISYNLYWGFVVLTFLAMRFRETKGRWPFMKAKKAKDIAPSPAADDSSEAAAENDKTVATEKTTAA